MKLVRWLTLTLNFVVFLWMLAAAWRDPEGPTSLEDKLLLIVLFSAVIGSLAVMIDLLFIRRR